MFSAAAITATTLMLGLVSAKTFMVPNTRRSRPCRISFVHAGAGLEADAAAVEGDALPTST